MRLEARANGIGRALSENNICPQKNPNVSSKFNLKKLFFQDKCLFYIFFKNFTLEKNKSFRRK